MRTLPKPGKPYTVPNDHAPAETFVEVYAWDIARCPLLLANLRRLDGTPYLPAGNRGKVSTIGIVIRCLRRA